MNEPVPTSDSRSVPDWSAGLRVFGILYVIVGALAALAAPILGIFILILTLRHAPLSNSLPMTLLPLTWGATVLIWLGIGSILRRRWARALILCQSWIGFLTGVILLCSLLATTNFAALKALAPASPAVRGAQSPLLHVVVLLVAYALVVVWTASQVLFYGSEGARRTCERFDPAERWTDRCPLPVLAACVLLVHTALEALTHAGRLRLFPLARESVEGPAAAFLWVAFAAFALFSAAGFYRREPAVWWLYLVVYSAVMLSLIAAYFHAGGLELYRLAGTSDAALERMRHSPAYQRGNLLLGTSLAAAGQVAYLCWIRPYFRPDRGPLATEATARPAA